MFFVFKNDTESKSRASKISVFSVFLLWQMVSCYLNNLLLISTMYALLSLLFSLSSCSHLMISINNEKKIIFIMFKFRNIVYKAWNISNSVFSCSLCLSLLFCLVQVNEPPQQRNNFLILIQEHRSCAALSPHLSR